MYSLFSLALPRDLAADFLPRFYDGARALMAERYGVDIVGGDLSSSIGGVFVDVVCAGI